MPRLRVRPAGVFEAVELLDMNLERGYFWDQDSRLPSAVLPLLSQLSLLQQDMLRNLVWRRKLL